MNNIEELISKYKEYPPYDSLSDEEEDKKYKIGQKITKKVLSVKIMDEYEKAKANGAIATLKFLVKYFTHGRGIKGSITEAANDFIYYSLLEKIFTIIFLPVEIPLIIGILLLDTGLSAIRLRHIIETSPKIVDGLKKSGKYEIVMENLEKFSTLSDDEEIYQFDGGDSAGVLLYDDSERKVK